MTVVYIARASDGTIANVYAGPQEIAQEAIEDNHPDVVAFYNSLKIVDLYEAVEFKGLNPVRFKLGMLYLNVTPTMVSDAIYALPEPDKTIAAIYWESTLVFRRDDPILAQVSAGFGLTAQQVDEAWRYAEQLK